MSRRRLLNALTFRHSSLPTVSGFNWVTSSQTLKRAPACKPFSSSACAEARPQFDWSKISQEKAQGWPEWLKAELRSDHAGETGAVWIYRGAKAAMEFRGSCSRMLHRLTGLDVGCPYRFREEPAYDFVEEHCKTEAAHLELMEKLVPPNERSRLIPLWKLSGFILGALPTLAWRTPTWLYVTVEAVETFVDVHYKNHIVPLEELGTAPELLRLLRHCCEEEIHHRDDASRRSGLPIGYEQKPFIVRVWFTIVARGSEIAVAFAKRV